jgi:crossover junction endodeoxyribonuclease RuvC
MTQEDNVQRIPVTHATVDLDMSLAATGFCSRQGRILNIETIKTAPKKHPIDLARFRYISDAVLERIPPNTVMICIEETFIPRQASRIGQAMNLAKLGAIMRLALYEAGFKFYVVTPQQLKKFATGKGTGQKGIIIREVYKKWGIDCKDDNQADACVMAHMAEGLHCWHDPNSTLVGELHKYQQDVLAKIVKERPSYNV